MNEKMTKKEIAVIAVIVASMVGSLVYGFFVVGIGKMPEPTPTPLSCWDKYKDTYLGEELMGICDGTN